MKKSKFALLPVMMLALCTAGCLAPRYDDPVVLDASTNAPTVKALSAAEAKEIIDNAIANPPAGHHPDNPGWLNLGRRATAVRLRIHNRTGLVLVEIMRGRSLMMEFYVQDMAEGHKFADALWRAKLESQAVDRAK